MDFPSDLLDEYCYQMFGHDNWEQLRDREGNIIIKFNKNKETLQ